MYARIRLSDGERQCLADHIFAVETLAGAALRPVGLEQAGRLAALLHDMGKATAPWQAFLLWAAAHPDEKTPGPSHAAAGAVFAYDRWYGGSAWRKITAQIVAMAVYGHHAGLPDCLDEDGGSRFLPILEQAKREELHCGEAAENFLREVADADRLDALFDAACAEMRAFFQKPDRRVTHFEMGLAVRLILSALVDADRWNSAAFERGEDALPPPEDNPPDWAALLGRLEAHLDRFPKGAPLAAIRMDVSRACLLGARQPRVVFQLTVPTGGGKTLASLRFALAHAARHGLRRILYVIPFNTILDQNADEIIAALDGYPVLEHHSGVTRDSEAEYTAHRRLTERWDEGIILTSMVQFLNAFYRKENTDARRLRALTDAVILFDEVQALPKKCTVLFERAVRFLASYCGCTALIMTATQPQLDLPGRDLVADVPKLFRDLRRVEYVDESRRARDDDQAAEGLLSLLNAHRSLLAVVNTKAEAQSLYDRVRRAAGAGVTCAHLSTFMCPEHRRAVLRDVKARLDGGQRVFLVSTALIEAGVNISFPAVVRSLAGLPSIIQVGGRCNRNGEADRGTVYIWRLAGESLSRLWEVRMGQKISDEILDHLAARPADLGSPDIMDHYFKKEREDFKPDLPFPYARGGWVSTLADMLSQNNACRLAAAGKKQNPLEWLYLAQSFRTAGGAFHAIDEATTGILVPYGEGEEIILNLAGRHGMKDEILLMRRAQRFSVSVFRQTFQKLEALGALAAVGETGAMALKKAFYDQTTGLRLEPGALEFLYN